MDAEHKKAYDFLTSHKFAVLSTTSKEGKSWGSTVYYVVDESLNFFFLTHEGSEKCNNIRARSQAAITIADDYTQTTVQCEGHVIEVPLGPEHDHALRMITAIHPPGQFAWIPPITKMHNGQVVLFKLLPERLRFSNFKPEQGEGETEILEVI